MISFLRRIRLYLLSENRFSTYLLYATGEIVLLVIGILIALQINNWNEDRLSAQQEIVILREIHQDLVGDIENQINPCIEYYAGASESFEFLRSNFYESSAVVSDDSIRENYFNVLLPWYLSLNSASFENLISTGTDLISNDSLRRDITSFYGYRYEALKKHNTYTETWFRTDILPLVSDNVNLFEPLSDEDRKFLRSDDRFATRVRSLVARKRNFRNSLLQIKPVAEQLALNIENEIGRLEEEYN